MYKTNPDKDGFIRCVMNAPNNTRNQYRKLDVCYYRETIRIHREIMLSRSQGAHTTPIVRDMLVVNDDELVFVLNRLGDYIYLKTMIQN